MLYPSLFFRPNSVSVTAAQYMKPYRKPATYTVQGIVQFLLLRSSQKIRFYFMLYLNNIRNH